MQPRPLEGAEDAAQKFAVQQIFDLPRQVGVMEPHTRAIVVS